MDRHLLAISLGCGAAVIASGDALAGGDTPGTLFGANQTLQLGLSYQRGEHPPHEQPPVPAPLDDLWTEAEPAPALSAELAWLPARQFRLALDVQWSYLDKPAMAGVFGDPAAASEKRDAWDYRLGAEWEFQPGWVVRGGYNRSQTSKPSYWLNTGWPDENGHSLDLGIGMSGRRWSIDAVYEYTWAQTVHAADGSDGFLGDWQNGQHVGGITATFRY